MTYREKYRAAIKLDTEILRPVEIDKFRRKVNNIALACPGDLFDGAPICKGVCTVSCADCWNQEAR